VSKFVGRKDPVGVANGVVDVKVAEYHGRELGLSKCNAGRD
jgi:hypothetical protein